MWKLLKRAARWLLVLGGVLCLLVVLAIAVLQSTRGERTLADWVAHLLSRRDLVVRIDGVSGNLPFSANIESVTFDDARGRWLEVRNLSVRAKPGELLRGRVVLISVHAAAVDLARRPRLAKDDGKDSEPPRSLRSVDVGDLVVDAIRLGPELLTPDDMNDTNDANDPNETHDANDTNGASDLHDDFERMRWSTPIAALASGRYSLHSKTVVLRAELEAQDARGLLPESVGLDAGPTTVSVYASGFWQRPVADVTVALQRPAGREAGAESLVAMLHGAPTGAPPDADAAEREPYDLRIDLLASSPRIDADLDRVLGGEPHLFARARIQAGGDLVRISSLRVDGAGGTLEASGRLEDRRRLRVGTATVHIADLGLLEGRVGEVADAGAVELTADGVVDLRERSARGNARLVARGVRTSDARFQSLVGDEAEATGSFERTRGGVIAIHDLEARTGAASMRASATLAPSRVVDAVAQILVADLAALSQVANVGLEGSLTAELRAGGSLDDLHVELNASPQQTRVAGGPKLGGRISVTANDALEAATGQAHAALTSYFGDLTGSLTFARAPGEWITLSGIDIRTPHAAVQADVRIDERTDEIDGRLSAKATDLRTLSPLLGARTEGSATIQASVSGSQAEVSARLSHFRYRGLEGFKTEELNLDASLVDITSQPGGTIRLRAKDASLADVSIAAINGDARGADGRWESTVSVEGRYVKPFRLRGAGLLELPEQGYALHMQSLEGEIDAFPLRLQHPFSISSQDGVLAAGPLDIALADGRVAGAAKLDADAIDGRVEIDALPLALLRLYDSGIDLSGAVEGAITLDGTRANPDVRFVADAASVTVGATKGTDLPPIAIHAEGRWGAEGLVADGSIEGGQGTSIRARVRAPRTGEPSSLEVDGIANLALVNGTGVLGEDRLGGTAEANVRITGTAAAPRVTGGMAIRGGSYENAALAAVVRDAEIELAGSDTQLVLRRFDAGDGEQGRMRVAGAIDFSGGLAAPVFTADVNMKHMCVARLDDLTVTAGGDLRVSRDADGLAVAGVVESDSVNARIPESDDVEVVVFENVLEKNVEAARPDRFTVEARPLGAVVALDVRIRMPRRVFVRGTDIDTEWEGDLKVKGTNARPLITGKLSLVRGSFRLLNVRLNGESGEISFDGAEKIDPMLDIVGTAARHGIEARIRVTGRASNPDLEVTSDPPLPEDEILARLMFGKEPGQLTPVESVQLAAALARLTGRGGGTGMDPLGWLRRTFNVDTLEVTSADTPEGGSVLSVGKYLSRNVFVSVNQGLTDNTSSAAVEVELTDHLTLESKLGRDAEGSLGLNWKWDF